MKASAVNAIGLFRIDESIEADCDVLCTLWAGHAQAQAAPVGGRWERGDNAIKAFQLAALAELYGLEPDAYYQLVDPPEPVNPWRGRLSAAHTDALEWERSRRNESQGSPADQGSERKRSVR